MQIALLQKLLDDPQAATDWFAPLGVVDAQRGHANLVSMSRAGLALDPMNHVCASLAEMLPPLSDPDRALNNLERFVVGSRSPLSLGTLFERDPESLGILLQIFSSSQYLSDILATDSASYDLLRLTEGQPVTRDVLIGELISELSVIDDRKHVMTTLRRFKHRENLRIGYGDLIKNHSLEIVTSQISYLADAIVQGAVRSARAMLEKKIGVPTRPDGNPACFTVLALGKLGGSELNYSSDIDLIFLYDSDGSTVGPRRQTNREFFDAMSREVVRLLTETTELGIAYRVDLRLRPEGKHGPIVTSTESALQYYDVLGRTWERQAMVKARAIAGDVKLGQEFLGQLEPWIYRRYLHRADITGIKALKRRIDLRAKREGASLLDVKTGHGGIRDIEFVIQFLQLLNGAELPSLRTGNTLEAIVQLEAGGCLNHQERSILEENYRFLRTIEHGLQIMFDLQTHMLPTDRDELRKLAIRMRFPSDDKRSAREEFEQTYENTTKLNRQILDHLLHDAFGNDDKPEQEVDLVLDPEPPEEFIQKVLAPYRFQSIDTAYQNLMELSVEKIRFLSTRRCRHFLASIAPRLLDEISHTPDPDSTLVNLVKVSDSIGGKGVLWELFSYSRPSLKLFVELCSSSPFLTDILITNPGMIDELMDSLVVNRLPSRGQLDETLSDLCRGAEDIEPILHSFKNTQQLHVGVRDILGKENIQTTNATLGDIAQACLKQITLRKTTRLMEKFGQPTIGSGRRTGEPCELVIIGMGKFGGREPNYHSDLDLIFLYEADGPTDVDQTSRRTANPTTNQHFFGELGQRIIKDGTRLGPYGRLYEIDPRLRPTGKSGTLATSFNEFFRYFAEGHGQLWERLALCKARVVYGSPEAGRRAMSVIWQAAFGPKWNSTFAKEIYEMRLRLEKTASSRNLKRGPGGIVDIEFLVQMLQLKHGGKCPAIRLPGTLDALAALRDATFLAGDDFEFFDEAYRFLRNVEARLRLMNTAARHDLPSDEHEQELVKLARLLGYVDSAELLEKCYATTIEVRRRFDRLFRANEKGD